MTLRLVHGSLDDWFVLEGGGNWACVEGSSAEWLRIATSLRDRKPTSFTRLALTLSLGRWIFYSPRNSRGDQDEVQVPESDMSLLATHIESVVQAYATREPRG